MVRFGVIGTNRITEEFISAGRELNGFDLTAVYSRTQERGQEFAARFDIPHTFTDLEQMAQSGEIDAVYIASPNALHAGQAVLCMNHGKHVLCEKPSASNTAELQTMISSAVENNVVFMEALKSTLMPNFRAVQENLHKVGKVRRYFASYCQYSSRYDAYKAGTILNAFNPALSNGALMDIGVYCIYPLVVLFGKPDRIQAEGLMLESGVDGEGSLILKYKEMDAVILYSKITNSYIPSEIQGESGSLIMDTINHLGTVEIRYRDGSVEQISKPQGSRTMIYEIREFMDLIQNEKVESQINSHAHSLAAMEIMDEVRRQIGIIFPAD